MSFLDFRFLDLIDILLVAFLLYQLYRLIKDTVAINVLIGVAAIYVIWKLVGLLEMELLSEILGKFIGVGVIALVIVFQQEIRKFFLVIGSTSAYF
jgi:diadenylate cyclase